MQMIFDYLKSARMAVALCVCLLLSMAQPAQAYSQHVRKGKPCAETACGDKKRGKHPRHFDAAKFKKDFSAFVGKQARLTEDERRAFFPVFFEMQDKKRNAHRQKNRALRQAAEKNMNERDCQRVLNEVAEMDKKALRIETEYMARLRKIVGSRKLVKVLAAERKFSRSMFKQMTTKNP